jgi:hypothetical protein
MEHPGEKSEKLLTIVVSWQRDGVVTTGWVKQIEYDV